MEWLEWAEPIAYGPLGLKPWEFERLQPHEFMQLWDGYRWRQEQQENLMAYFVSGLMNVSGKKLKRLITSEDLIKPLRQPVRNRKQDEEYLMEQFGLNGGEGHSNSS